MNNAKGHIYPSAAYKNLNKMDEANYHFRYARRLNSRMFDNADK